jgi:hypothetical protein
LLLGLVLGSMPSRQWDFRPIGGRSGQLAGLANGQAR